MKRSVAIAAGVALCWTWAEGWEEVLIWLGVKSTIAQVLFVLLISGVAAHLFFGRPGHPPAWQRLIWHRMRGQVRTRRRI